MTPERWEDCDLQDGIDHMTPDPNGRFVLYDEVRDTIIDHYKVAPKAAIPLLTALGYETETAP